MNLRDRMLRVLVASLGAAAVSWPLVGDSVKENNTVENLARLFTAAKRADFGVFISPHYLYPHDQAWRYGGAVEKMMLEGKEFWRPGPLDLGGKHAGQLELLDHRVGVDDRFPGPADHADHRPSAPRRSPG